MIATRRWVKDWLRGAVESVSREKVTIAMNAIDQPKLTECHECGCVIFKKEENKGPSEVKLSYDATGVCPVVNQPSKICPMISCSSCRWNVEIIHNNYYCKRCNPKFKIKDPLGKTIRVPLGLKRMFDILNADIEEVLGFDLPYMVEGQKPSKKTAKKKKAKTIKKKK